MTQASPDLVELREVAQGLMNPAERKLVSEAANTIERLREALVAHNDLLRSAFQAAQRDATHDVRGTTNYRTLADRAADVLQEHHSTVVDARAALNERTDNAPE